LSNQQKKNTFYGAAAILTVSTILVKIIGAIFKIPLIAILPEEAYGDFNGAYNIYSFFLTISTAGLPVALSKTVSECHTLGRENQKHRVFRVAFCAFLFMGLFSFLCMSVFGQLVATYIIGNEKAVFCVWALAPAVLCTCCCSAFRGYAQGHMNMMPTAISQIIEALCKLFLGLGLAMVIMSLTLWPEDIRNRLAASGALIGVSFGSVLSVIYLAFNHFRTRRGSAARAADAGRARLVKHRTAGHSHAGTVGTQHQADILAHQLRRGGGRLVGSGTVVRVDQLHVVGGATDVHRGGLLIGILHTQHLLLAAGTGVAGGGLEHTDADHIPPAAAGVAGGCVAAAARGGGVRASLGGFF